MKKFVKLLIVFVLFFITIGTVNAEEVFKYDWSKDLRSDIVTWNEEIPYNTHFNFKNGYVNADVYGTNYPITKLTYYDYKGTELASTTLRYNIVLGMNNIDDNLYVVSLNYDESLLYIIKYDDKLNEINSIEVPEVLIDEFSSILDILKMSGINMISNVNNQITIVGEYDKLYVFDSELEDYNIRNVSENLIKKYYPKVYEGETSFSNVIDDYTRFLSFDTKNEKKVGSGVISECRINVPRNVVDEEISTYLASCPSSGFIEMLDENNDILWKKEFEEYKVIVNARFVDNYIVAIGYTGENVDEIDSDILILNMEGNIVQKIVGEESKYLLIEPSEAGFAINRTVGTCRSVRLEPIEGRDSIVYDCEMSLEAYYLPRNIEAKVLEGKGEVNIVGVARNGEEVTYEIVPDSGYVLGVVKITDKDGNVVEYTTNRFTMPASDVTMEVTFLPKNPETKDLAIIGISIILILGFGLVITNYKKLRFLKQ